MPAPVMIVNRPLLPRLLLLFWLAEIAVGLLFVAAGWSLLGPGENGGALVLMLMGALLTGLGIVITGQCWTIARCSGAAIEMTDEGLFDHRQTRGPIPWTAISWKVIFSGRAYALHMDVTEPWRSSAGFAWPARAQGYFNRLMRRPEFTLPASGTGLSVHQLAERLSTFKPPVD